MAIDIRHTLDLAGLKVPHVEIPATTGGEDSCARWSEEGCGFERGVFDVECGCGGIGFAVDVVEAESRVVAGGEEERVGWVEGYAADAGARGVVNVAVGETVDVEDFGAESEVGFWCGEGGRGGEEGGE